MYNSDILSVDPGRNTLGALYPEMDSSLILKEESCIQTKEKEMDESKKLSSPLLTLSANAKAIYVMLLRWALGAVMIISGSLILSGVIKSQVVSSDVYAIIEIAAGTLLALGLLTRISMGAAALGFAAVAAISTFNGIFCPEAMMCCLSCLVFVIFGSGKYSADSLIHKAMKTRASRRRATPLNYRAFRNL